MAIFTNPLDSQGGFSVGTTTVLTDTRDLKNINSLSIQNNNYNDASKNDYILRGLNSGFLTVDGINLLTLPSNSINFITSTTVGIDTVDSSSYYSIKYDSTVTVDSSGDVLSRSRLKTTISEQIPFGQSWIVLEYDSGSPNQFSLSTSVSGTTNTVKWISHIQVINILL